jgi:hypothetical protein
LPDGKRIYLAYRRLDQIYRFGESSISDAIRSRKAAWAIDDETLLQMRAQGVRYVGVLCRDNRDIWLTTIDQFFGKATVLNYAGRGGALQRYLPLTHFKRRAGAVKL